MKIRLLNDGSYSGMEEVNFPVMVEVESFGDSWVRVAGSQLKSVGASVEYFEDEAAYIFCRRLGGEQDEFEFIGEGE